jgi:hypothetical protein
MKRAFVFVIAAAALLAPSPAAAQTGAHTWFASPFLGATFGGDTTTSAPVVGAAAGWIGTGRFGFEAEVADSPEFFEQSGFLTSRRVTTVMGNALFLAGPERVRVYAIGGGGLVRPHLAEAGDLARGQDQASSASTLAAASPTSRTAPACAPTCATHTVRSSDTDANPFGLDFSRFSSGARMPDSSHVLTEGGDDGETHTAFALAAIALTAALAS